MPGECREPLEPGALEHQLEAFGMSAMTSDDYDEHEESTGRIMPGEMAQQPAVLRRILDEGAPRIREVAAAIAAKKPRFVLPTARGTSGHAALYAKYLLEIRLGLPCGLTSRAETGYSRCSTGCAAAVRTCS